MKTSIISRPYCHGLASQSLIQTHTIQYNKKLHIIFCTNIFIKSSPILPLRSPRLTESQRPVMNWNSRKYFENSYFNGKQKKENKKLTSTNFPYGFTPVFPRNCWGCCPLWKKWLLQKVEKVLPLENRNTDPLLHVFMWAIYSHASKDFVSERFCFFFFWNKQKLDLKKHFRTQVLCLVKNSTVS